MAIDDPAANGPDDERFLTWRRVRNVIIGCVVALIVGVLASFAYTSMEYGGSPLDRILGSKKPDPAIGKLAYDKNTHYFIGIIRSEGHSVKRGTDVYYVERAGGEMIDMPKNLVDVRARGEQP